MRWLKRVAWIFACVVVCVGLYAASDDEPEPGEILVRFTNGKADYVQCVGVHGDRFMLKFRDVPGAIPVNRSEIHPADAAALHAQYLGLRKKQEEELQEPPPKKTQPPREKQYPKQPVPPKETQTPKQPVPPKEKQYPKRPVPPKETEAPRQPEPKQEEPRKWKEYSEPVRPPVQPEPPEPAEVPKQEDVRKGPPPGEFGSDEIMVRFINEKAEHVRIVQVTTAYVLMKFRDVSEPIPVRWEEIYPDDARMLRKEFYGAGIKPPLPVEFALDGLRVFTRGNKIFEGVPMAGSPDTEIWLKSRGMRQVIRRRDVLRTERIRVGVRDVYTDEELYQILVQRLAPETAEDWELIGQELARIGLEDRAFRAFRTSEILRHPELMEGRIFRALLDLRNLIDDVSLKKVIQQARERYLVGAYDEVIAKMDLLERRLIGAGMEWPLSELRRLREEIHLLRSIAREEKAVAEWGRTLSATVRRKAFDRGLSCEDAMAYIETNLVLDVEKRVSEQLGLSKEDAAARYLWERRPLKGLRKHCYGESTWVVERRERADHEAWWSRATDVQRYELLMGITIEQHLDLKQVIHKNCPICGGDGVVEVVRYPDQPGGRCPTCLGMGAYRVLIYR
ncbi:MAG: hypothetical protein ACYTAF_01170 [Planctomycetota bacterium]|jgi:hypothetical protein